MFTTVDTETVEMFTTVDTETVEMFTIVDTETVSADATGLIVLQSDQSDARDDPWTA